MSGRSGWSRREFAGLAGMAAMARFVPGLEAGAEVSGAEPGQTEPRQIGYCVIGLGRIADHFMRGVKSSKTCRITGLVSGHRDKAVKIAKEYGVPESAIYSYEDMDRMAENKAIEAVYVALPNAMHAEYTIRSARAGKHVLCEKPMSTTVEDAKLMITACKAAKVKLMIAYRLHYEPLNLQAVQLIRDGALGMVQAIDSSFGFNIAPGEWRLNKKLSGGGPLMDVGIYALNATRYLTGEEPVAFKAQTATRDQDGRFKEVEESLAWTAQFPSGILASCSTTYGAQMDGFYKVFGSQGHLEMDPAFNYDGLKLKAIYSAPGGRKTVDVASNLKDPVQFQVEAEHFAECIVRDTEPLTPGEEGLRDLEYMKTIYGLVGIKMDRG